MKENWKFSELEYVRPDFEKVKEKTGNRPGTPWSWRGRCVPPGGAASITSAANRSFSLNERGGPYRDPPRGLLSEAVKDFPECLK